MAYPTEEEIKAPAEKTEDPFAKKVEVAEEISVVEASSTRNQTTSVGIDQRGAFFEATDTFVPRVLKHFTPKPVEVDGLPGIIAANAVKTADGKAVGVLLGAGVTVQRTVVSVDNGSKTADGSDVASRISEEVYVPLTNISGLESTLRTREMSRQ